MKVEPLNTLEEALKRFPPLERQACVKEVKRLTYIVQTYAPIQQKRQLNHKTGKYEFVSDVLLLCQQAKCNDPVIISREPHRAFSPSPHTLDRWHKNYQRSGPTVFLRNPSKVSSNKTDHRCATISVEAVDYINRNWRQYQNPHFLYLNLKTEANMDGVFLVSLGFIVVGKKCLKSSRHLTNMGQKVMSLATLLMYHETTVICLPYKFYVEIIELVVS